MIKSVLKTIITLMTLVVAFGATTVYRQSLSYDAPRSYTYKLVSNHGVGSAVLIAHNLGITAAHVTGPKGDGFTMAGKPIKVLNYDAKLDLTLFEVDIACPCAPLGSIPKEDDFLVAVGYPLGVGKYVTEGRMQTVHFDDIKLETSVPIMFGNSGGGLYAFQNWQWKLVGIMSQVHGTNLGFFGVPVPTMSRAVPITNIIQFIHSSKYIGVK
jgi:S1-C subfamily serine protease